MTQERGVRERGIAVSRSSSDPDGKVFAPLSLGPKAGAPPAD